MLVADRAFLASHARVLGIAQQPGVRLPGIAARLGITERSAQGIVAGLAEAGYMVKLEDGRRNRYQSPGTPAAARTHPAGTHLRRSPGLLAGTGAGLLNLPVRRRCKTTVRASACMSEHTVRKVARS